MGLRLKDADRSDIPVVTTSMTLVEAYPAKLHRPAWRWALSRLRVEPATEQIANDAIDLLQEAGLHGHKYAIDAALATPVAALLGRVQGDREPRRSGSPTGSASGRPPP
jgi:hypothetical protein